MYVSQIIIAFQLQRLVDDFAFQCLQTLCLLWMKVWLVCVCAGYGYYYVFI